MPGMAGQAPIEVTVETRGQEIVAGTLWVHERGGQSAMPAALKRNGWEWKP